MKKCLLVLLLISSFSLPASVSWFHSFEQAQKLALSTNKLILVDFFATWCGPCKLMDREVWSDPEVEKFVNYFVPLKIDVDLQHIIARKYDIQAMPSIFILDGNGEVVYKHIGYLNSGQVKVLLKKYAVQTKFMQKEALNYYLHKNYVTALQLGKKYLDFSLYLKGEPRDNFLNLAEKYLDKGKDLLEEDSDNYLMLVQKIELLELVSDLHSKNYKRVFRKISDRKEATIHEYNKKLYYYLHYCCEKGLNKVSAEKWYSKLATNEMYYKKADLLLGETEE